VNSYPEPPGPATATAGSPPASPMFESRFGAYLIFLYDGPLCAEVSLLAWPVACRFVGPPIRSATKVPKEIDEKHELSRRCRDSGARMRAALDSKSISMTSYIDIYIPNQ